MAAGRWEAQALQGNRRFSLSNETGADAYNVTIEGAVVVPDDAQLAHVRAGEAVPINEAKTMGNSEDPLVTWTDDANGSERHEFRVAL